MAFVLYLILEPREYSKYGTNVMQLAQALGRKCVLSSKRR